MIEVAVKHAKGAFDLDVAFKATQRITAIFGPSGSGKSTLLNAISGLLNARAASIKIDGEEMAGTSPHLRRIGQVFQDSHLFPHMSVEKNLRYGLKSTEKFDAIVASLGLTPLLSRRPLGLSGGERQRVAIARAILADPRLLLMDEPLANLGIAHKREILPFIASLPMPVIYVSHAAGEIMRIADEAIVIEGGRIQAQGKPADVLPPFTAG